MVTRIIVSDTQQFKIDFLEHWMQYFEEKLQPVNDNEGSTGPFVPRHNSTVNKTT